VKRREGHPAYRFHTAGRGIFLLDHDQRDTLDIASRHFAVAHVRVREPELRIRILDAMAPTIFPPHGVFALARKSFGERFASHHPQNISDSRYLLTARIRLRDALELSTAIHGELRYRFHFCD